MLNLWLAFPVRKKAASIVAVLLTLLAVFALTRIATRPQLDILYSNIDTATAGEIVSRLQTMDVAYDVRGNVIYADRRRRDSLRLELAREGLPRQNVVGYELFDDLNSFAMSSEMFDTAYWRAREGELARTILSMPNVKGARVHLGTQPGNPFSRDRNDKTASVTLSTIDGVSPEQAKAIQFLTALSVAGLNPSDVAIVDTISGLVAGPGLAPDTAPQGSDELDRARELKNNLLSLLEARVGPGNARVNVFLEVDRVAETTTSRQFDPENRVLKSQTTSEVADTSSGTSANVTVASNLPEGGAAGGNNTSERNETTETVSYEISEILTNRETLPGAIKRMTIAVLVNDVRGVDENGETIFQSRSEAELTQITDLVSASAGIDQERGDRLSVESMAFDLPPPQDLIEAAGFMETFLDRYLWNLIQSLILAVVAIILGFFVVKPLFMPRALNEEIYGELSPMSLAGPSAVPGVAGPAAAQGLPAPDALPGLPGAAETSGTAGAVTDSQVPPDPVDLLKAIVKDRKDDTVELISDMLSAEGEAV